MRDIVTIGDAMITFDPAATGPLRFVDSFKRKVGGAELNFAVGCARLGLETGWISRLGKDEFGLHIKNFVRGEGIDVSQVHLMEKYATSLNIKEIRGDGSGKTFYYRHPTPTETLTPDGLDASYIQESRILHITGVFPAITPSNADVVDEAVRIAKAGGVKISLDPNIRLKMWSKEQAKEKLLTWLKDTDILLAGVEELEIMFGSTDINLLLEKLKEYDVEHIFIKKGAEGAVHAHNDKVHTEPARKANAVDTVGAGDGFNAGAIYGLLNNWESKKTLEFANTIGSMVVEIFGDNEGLPYLEEVEAVMGQRTIIDR